MKKIDKTIISEVSETHKLRVLVFEEEGQWLIRVTRPTGPENRDRHVADVKVNVVG